MPLRFENLLDRLTELTESYYAHSYVYYKERIIKSAGGRNSLGRVW